MVGSDAGGDGDGGGLAGLVVVSNREPYAHEYTADGIDYSQPTGGLVSALDSVVADLGGTWVAWGSGDADFDPAVVDDTDTVGLPPGDPQYDLRRVALSRSQVDEYYYGYSNQVLWPLCHLDTNYVDVQPPFWPAYETVNARFAEAVLDAVADSDATPSDDGPPVWLQDYHLTLVPRYLRERGYDAGPLVHFWHIPWPPAEVFAICPQAEQVLDGLLASDAVGFHTARYRRHFLDTVAELLPDADVDHEAGRVTYDGRETTVYVAPVGVDTGGLAATAREDESGRFWRELVRKHGLDDTTVAVGVDRLDYTKGILERFDALERLWATRPGFRESLTFVQKASRSRAGIEAYREYHDRVRDRVYELNQRFGTDDWTPVVYLEGDRSKRDLLGLYRNADCCVVSSRRDGMNLVAKEFVAASTGVGGTLVVSEFAGVAETLGDAAVRVNPFDTDSFAERLAAAVEMDADERTSRFERLRERVWQEDIDAWLVENTTLLGGAA